MMHNLKFTGKPKKNTYPNRTGSLLFLTIVFKTILAFVKSVAVHSMNTFFVFKVMAEWAPLIIGGKDKTVLQTVPLK